MKTPVHFLRQFKNILNYNQNNVACDLIQNSGIVELSARLKIRNLQYGDRQGKKNILHDILNLKKNHICLLSNSSIMIAWIEIPYE